MACVQPHAAPHSTQQEATPRPSTAPQRQARRAPWGGSTLPDVRLHTLKPGQRRMAQAAVGLVARLRFEVAPLARLAAGGLARVQDGLAGEDARREGGAARAAQRLHESILMYGWRFLRRRPLRVCVASSDRGYNINITTIDAAHSRQGACVYGVSCK